MNKLELASRIAAGVSLSRAKDGLRGHRRVLARHRCARRSRAPHHRGI